MARLGSHSGVVGIFDVGETTEEIPFIVIEYVEGEPLRSLMSNSSKNSPFSTNEIGQLSFTQTAEIISQTAEALAFAHREKIIHRDIKPENIMLQTDDARRMRVRVIDFGIAKVVESLVEYDTKTGVAPATLRYASPEQITGEKQLTGASDQFSLAVVAYEMLTGELPFQAQNVFQMVRLHQEGVNNLPRILRPDLPAEAETVLLRALSYNPQNRFPDITDFSNSLKTALTANAFSTKPEIPVIFPTTREVKFNDKDAAEQNDFRNAKTVKFDPPVPTPIPETNSKWLLPFGGIILLLVLALMFFLWNWQEIKKPPPDSGETNSAASVSNADTARRMSYWLEVQKIRGGRPFGESFESSGREIFESGYKFRLNYKNENTGYFYLFNEGKNADGKINFNILYPIPIAGKDSALTEKDKPIQTVWNTFGGTAATEKV